MSLLCSNHPVPSYFSEQSRSSPNTPQGPMLSTGPPHTHYAIMLRPGFRPLACPPAHSALAPAPLAFCLESTLPSIKHPLSQEQLQNLQGPVQSANASPCSK